MLAIMSVYNAGLQDDAIWEILIVYDYDDILQKCLLIHSSSLCIAFLAIQIHFALS